MKRNATRFPTDFMFQLTAEEKSEVVTNCDHLSKLRFFPHRPYVFTEHGALMLANVLNSERATEASVQVVRTFVRLRQLLASNTELARRLESLEKKYDTQFKVIFDAIRQLMTPPPTKRREIGFHVRQDESDEIGNSTHRVKKPLRLTNEKSKKSL